MAARPEGCIQLTGLTVKSLYQKIYDSDVGHSFLTSPTAILAAVIAFICIFCALFAPWVAPHNPFDLATLELSNARLPPAWSAGGNLSFPLGTDDQGRDILSALIFGARISLVVGLASVFLSVVFGVALGLLAGFMGGWVDSLLMRLCDIMLSFPAILIALLLAGVCRALRRSRQASRNKHAVCAVRKHIPHACCISGHTFKRSACQPLLAVFSQSVQRASS